jgi:hypothetical protein
VQFALDKCSRRRAVAALAGAIVLPSFQAQAGAPPAPAAPTVVAGAAASGVEVGPPAPLAPPRDDLKAEIPTESCLAQTLCAIKDRVRWKGSKWTPEYCQVVAKGVLAASAKHDLPPALLLAVMMNESDLDEKSFATHFKGEALYAKDSGLMGIRCVMDSKGRCLNGHVRGLNWKEVMDPMTNIELGARELAHWRDGGGVTMVTVHQRLSDGQVIERKKYVPCKHKTHAYWAHYNHGPRYIDSGPARHYPHRIAVIYYALANVLGVPAPELGPERTITIHDPGLRQRTADHPVEVRYRHMCEKILSVRGVCRPSVATDGVPAAQPRPTTASN